MRIDTLRRGFLRRVGRTPGFGRWQEQELAPLAARRTPRQIRNMVRPAVDIDHLTVDERFELIERLSDSLRSQVGGLPLSAEEREIIEARRTAHRRDPSTAVAWETVRAELAADQDADDQTRPSGSHPGS